MARRHRSSLAELGAGTLAVLSFVSFAPWVLLSAGGASAAAKDAASAKAPAPSGSVIPGRMNRGEFEEALKPYLPAMSDCYDNALKVDAVAEGRIALLIETMGGKVTSARTDRDASTLKLDDVHECVIKIAQKMKMPMAKRAKGGDHDPHAKASVRYPLDFSLGIDVAGAELQVTGAKLDYDKVKNVFSFERLSIGRCWLEAKKAKKGAAAIGKLVLKVSTVGGGVAGVEEVASESTVADPTLRKCVVDAARKFRFPLAKDDKGRDDPMGASVITYPVHFKAR